MAKRTKSYGLNNPLQDVFAVPVISQRSPTVNDTNYELGQQWINKSTNESYVLTSSTAGAANWVITGLSAAGFPITPFVVGIAGQAGYQTIQAALDAANAAGGGLVYIQNGSYTESLMLFDNIQLMGDSEQGTILIGTHTPPSSGTLNIFRLTLQASVNIFNSAAAGTTAIIVEDCTCTVANGYTFNLLNWTSSGSIAVFNIGNFGTDDGFVNNTGGTGFFAFATGLGNGTANSMVLSGVSEFSAAVEIGCPISLGTGASLTSIGSLYRETITLTGDATINSSNDTYNTGATPALTYNTTGDSNLSNVVIDSSSDPSIDGTGAGTLTLCSASFIDDTTIFGIASTVNIASGNIRGGNFLSQFVVALDGTAPYSVIQAAVDNAADVFLETSTAQVVYVKPGVYTENISLQPGVDIWGAVGTANTQTCVIQGTHTPPFTGICTIRNIFLSSATNIFNSASAGSSTIVLIDDAISVSSGYTFNLPNWTGTFSASNIVEVQSTTDGWINNTAGATVFMNNVIMGAKTGNAMNITGPIEIYNCVVACSTNFQTGTIANISGGTVFQEMVTFSDNSTATVYNSSFVPSFDSAITYNSSGDSFINTSNINSGTSPSIAGTGAGTLTLTDVSFTDSNTVAATLTVAGGDNKSGTFRTIGTNFDSTLLLSGNTVSSEGSASPDIDVVVSPQGSGLVQVEGNLSLSDSATQFQIKGSAVTDFIGQVTLVAGAAVVANTNISSADRIFLTREGIGGSTGIGSLAVVAIVAGVSFTINSLDSAAAVETLDISDVNYVIIREI